MLDEIINCHVKTIVIINNYEIINVDFDYLKC